MKTENKESSNRKRCRRRRKNFQLKKKTTLIQRQLKWKIKKEDKKEILMTERKRVNLKYKSKRKNMKSDLNLGG